MTADHGDGMGVSNRTELRTCKWKKQQNGTHRQRKSMSVGIQMLARVYCSNARIKILVEV